MEIIKDKKEIEKIIDFDNKLKFTSFKVFNTPWAKDTINRALFVELEDNNGKKFYWLISELELYNLSSIFKEVKNYNMKYNHQGKEWWKFLEGD